MTDIFTDVSAEGLRRVSAEHYFDSFTCFSAVPGVEVYQGKDMIWVASPGIPNGQTNAIVRCRLSPDIVEDVIDGTYEYFSARGVVPHWKVCPGDLPPDLERRLAGKGYTLAGEQPAMAADLEKLNWESSAPEGLVIQRVTDEAMMLEKHIAFRQMRQERSFLTLALDLFRHHGYGLDSAWQHYIALLDGEPVSCASAFTITGVVGIYSVGTMPEASRKGVGSAITLRALLDARARGYRVGVLQSSEMGYNMYRRLGFETCFTIKTFVPAEDQPG